MRLLDNQIWIKDGKVTKIFSFTKIMPDTADVADSELKRLLQGFQNLNSGGISGIFVTDVVHPASPLNLDPIVDIPKEKELCGPIYKGNFRV